ncbi:MAG: glycosyltransferase family 4 protein [Dehalococcoidia bacterium]
MRVYLANIESWTFPNQGSEMLRQKGFEVGGNWLAPPFQRQLEDFSADVVVYAPHRRVDAVVLHKDDVLRVPTLLWALYPDHLTGWDREKNVHMDGFLESVADIMPYFRRHAVNSFFTKRLLEERIEGFQFEVCFLGLDLEAIDRCGRGKSPGRSSLTVLWQHRWRTDKNLRGALDIIETLAAKHRDVTFLVGRNEDWDEPFWVPQSLKDYFAQALPRLTRLGNVHFLSRFTTQAEYWRLLSEVDIAFSCSYHETFGIAMLEAAYAGAACVVPDIVAYPEIHSGALVVSHSEIASGLSRLIQEPQFRAEVAHSCRQNAGKYHVNSTAETLAGLIAQVRPPVGLVAE